MVACSVQPDSVAAAPFAPRTALSAAEGKPPLRVDLLLRLPEDVAVRIFLLIPIPQRLRCREVSPAWRALLASLRHVIWRTVDLSRASLGCECPGFTGHEASCTRIAPLVAAACAATGDAGIEALDISGHQLLYYELSGDDNDFKEYLASPFWLQSADWLALRNVRSLRAIDIGNNIFQADDLKAFIGAIFPLDVAALKAIEVDVYCMNAAEASLVHGMSGSPAVPGRVRARSLTLRAEGDLSQKEEAAAAARFLRVLAAHHSLRHLRLFDALLSDVDLCVAAADAAVNCSLETLHFHGEITGPFLLPQLTRVLRHGAIHTLIVEDLDKVFVGERSNLFGEGPAAGQHLGAFCAALHSAPIERLTLSAVGLWNIPEHAASLLRALRGHPTLASLNISSNAPTRPREDGEMLTAAGQLLASLIVEDACPALHSLSIARLGLSSSALARLFDAGPAIQLTPHQAGVPSNDVEHRRHCCCCRFRRCGVRRRSRPACCPGV